MPVSQEHIENKLQTELQPEYLKVEDFSDGCGMKYHVLVVAKKFEGMSLLQRQRLVNEILKDEMNEIHALTQKTLTPDQWNKLSAEAKDNKEQNTNEKCIK